MAEKKSESGWSHAIPVKKLLDLIAKDSTNFCLSLSSLCFLPEQVTSLLELAWNHAPKMSHIYAQQPERKLSAAQPEFWTTSSSYDFRVLVCHTEATSLVSFPHKIVPLDSTFTLEQGLSSAIGAIQFPDVWRFNSDSYLVSKNTVDLVSFNEEVWQKLKQLIANDSSITELRIIEIGAGHLSMLDRIMTLRGHFSKIHYVGLEREMHLIEHACQHKLQPLGFKLISSSSTNSTTLGESPKSLVYRLVPEQVSLDSPSIDVELSPQDLLDFVPKQNSHIVIGCCFADLIEPSQLFSILHRLAPGGLAYLPITFAGKTTLQPPFLGKKEAAIPSDEQVAEAYHESLRGQGQHLDLEFLIQVFAKAGGVLHCRGPSNWRVDPKNPDHTFFHSSLLYFIGLGVAPLLYPEWRIAEWLQHHRTVHSSFDIFNFDLLFQMDKND